MSHRTTLLAAAVVVALSVPAFAADVPTPSAAPIEKLNAALAATARNGADVPFAKRVELLTPAVDQAFDLDAVLRTSIGPRWDAMSAAEQGQVKTAFRRYTVASFAANFTSPADAATHVDVSRSLPNGDEVVDAQMGDSKLGYVMHQTDAGWRAVDVLADGTISRVATQRSDFRGVLSQGGAPSLVQSLEQKTAQLSG